VEHKRLQSCTKNDSDVALHVLQLKEVWVDAWCPQLTDTWESSAYQRAIAVDALWLTFMRMLEPASRIKVRNIICTDSLGESAIWLQCCLCFLQLALVGFELFAAAHVLTLLKGARCWIST